MQIGISAFYVVYSVLLLGTVCDASRGHYGMTPTPTNASATTAPAKPLSPIVVYNVSMTFHGGNESMCYSCEETLSNQLMGRTWLTDNGGRRIDSSQSTTTPPASTTVVSTKAGLSEATTVHPHQLVEPADFACSVDGVGAWNNGTRRFLDPLEHSVGKYILTQVTIHFHGQLNCRSTWDSPDTQFAVYLGEELLMERTEETKPCVCYCPTTLTFSTPELPEGLTNFQYHDWNTLRVAVNNNMICLSKVTLQLSYSRVDVNNGEQLPVRDWIIGVIAVVSGGMILLAVGFAVNRLRGAPTGYDQLPTSDNEGGSSLFGMGANNDERLHKPTFTIRGVEISLGPRIGKGSYGEVYRARWRGIDVAVKKLPYHLLQSKEFMRDFNQEANIMSALRHPNVLQFLGSTMIDNDICILTEFMSRGSLYQLLHQDTTLLPFQMIKRFALDTARGMLYLHKSNPVILHRDLKSHNLLVEDTYKVKISDFGLSKVVEHCNKTMTSCGTAAWAAPEILKNARYTEKADVYSFGICLWEFWTRKDPYEGMPTFQVIFSVGTEGLRPTIPESCPPDYIQLMKDCWDADPTKRPAFDELLMKLTNLENPEFKVDPHHTPSATHHSARSLLSSVLPGSTSTAQTTTSTEVSSQNRSDFYRNNIN